MKSLISLSKVLFIVFLSFGFITANAGNIDCRVVKKDGQIVTGEFIHMVCTLKDYNNDQVKEVNISESFIFFDGGGEHSDLEFGKINNIEFGTDRELIVTANDGTVHQGREGRSNYDYLSISVGNDSAETISLDEVKTIYFF